MVTPGALTAASIVAQAFTGPRDRVLVESPVYPNATQAITQRRRPRRRHAGRPRRLGPRRRRRRAARGRAALRLPDPRLPEPDRAPDDRRPARGVRRATCAAPAPSRSSTRRTRRWRSTGRRCRAPFAAFAPDTITLGSASKAFWGGLRLGWIRAPRERMDDLTQARLGLDLGAPVLEQLVLARLLADPDRDRRGAARPTARAARPAPAPRWPSELPDWRFVRPGGGLAVWCELPAAPWPRPLAAEAERLGVIVAPGRRSPPRAGSTGSCGSPGPASPPCSRTPYAAWPWPGDVVRTLRPRPRPTPPRARRLRSGGGAAALLAAPAADPHVVVGRGTGPARRSSARRGARSSRRRRGGRGSSSRPRPRRRTPTRRGGAARAGRRCGRRSRPPRRSSSVDRLVGAVDRSRRRAGRPASRRPTAPGQPRWCRTGAARPGTPLSLNAATKKSEAPRTGFGGERRGGGAGDVEAVGVERDAARHVGAVGVDRPASTVSAQGSAARRLSTMLAAPAAGVGADPSTARSVPAEADLVATWCRSRRPRRSCRRSDPRARGRTRRPGAAVSSPASGHGAHDEDAVADDLDADGRWRATAARPTDDLTCQADRRPTACSGAR